MTPRRDSRSVHECHGSVSRAPANLRRAGGGQWPVARGQRKSQLLSPLASCLLPKRSAATLTEVLMSLLIMSIGIVSVISIFPISLLRSIQANQLTNAKLMRQNVEQVLRSTFSATYPPSPGYSFRYDVLNQSTQISGTTILNVDTQIFRGTWQPGTIYYPGQIVTTSRPQGSVTPKPNVWFICTGVGTSGTGVSGSIEPNWEVATTATIVVDGYVAANTEVYWTGWYDPTTAGFPPVVGMGDPNTLTAATWYSARNYVVDPLGWAIYASNPLDFTGASPNDFGFKVDRNTGVVSSPPRPTVNPAPDPNAANPFLLRLNGGTPFVAAAEDLASHADSWSVELTDTLDIVPVVGATSATFRTGTDLSAFVIADAGAMTPLVSNAQFRIALTSLSSNAAVVRSIPHNSLTVTGVDVPGRTVNWAEPLPVGFVADGPARIERYDRRFTWLATVNKDIQGTTKVTVAVLFKRGFKPEEEHVYDANFGNFTVADNQWNGNSILGFLITADQIVIRWNAANEPDPLLKPGNYLLDGRNATWYRIVDVTARGTDANALPNYAILTVNRPVPTAQRTIDPTTPAIAGRVILMRGIVELFEL